MSRMKCIGWSRPTNAFNRFDQPLTIIDGLLDFFGSSVDRWPFARSVCEPDTVLINALFGLERTLHLMVNICHPCFRLAWLNRWPVKPSPVSLWTGHGLHALFGRDHTMHVMDWIYLFSWITLQPCPALWLIGDRSTGQLVNRALS